MIHKYVLFGDTQFHPWQESEDFTRWVRMVDVIGEAFYTAKDYGARAVIHMGDLFENKHAVRTDVFVIAFDEIRKCIEDTGLPLYIVCGNHDTYKGKALPTVLRTEGVTVIHGVDSYVIDKTNKVVAVPYGGKPPANLDYRVLLCHTDIRRCSYGGTRCSETSLIDEAVLLKRGERIRVFNGHYHHPQEVSLGVKYVPVTCVGSPYHVNWTDMDSPRRGCIKLRVGSIGVSYSRKTFHGFPVFLSSSDKARQGFDFVRRVEESVPDGTTVQHDDAHVVGGSNTEKSLVGYVNATVSDPRRRKRLIKTGVALYHGQ